MTGDDKGKDKGWKKVSLAEKMQFGKEMMRAKHIPLGQRIAATAALMAAKDAEVRPVPEEEMLVSEKRLADKVDFLQWARDWKEADTEDRFYPFEYSKHEEVYCSILDVEGHTNRLLVFYADAKRKRYIMLTAPEVEVSLAFFDKLVAEVDERIDSYLADPTSVKKSEVLGGGKDSGGPGAAGEGDAEADADAETDAADGDGGAKFGGNVGIGGNRHERRARRSERRRGKGRK